MPAIDELLPWETETPGELLFLTLYEFVKARAPHYASEHAWIYSNDGMREFFRLVMAMELTHRCMNLAVDWLESRVQLTSPTSLLFARIRSELNLYDSELAVRKIAELAHRAGDAYVGRKLTMGKKNETHRASSGWCCWCGNPTSNAKGTPRHERATVEHIWPEFLGGTSVTENLIIACEPCNGARQHAYSWAWFGLQGCNEQLDSHAKLPRAVALPLALYRLMRVASGQSRRTSDSLSLKTALQRLGSAIPTLNLAEDRRYTFFELLTLTPD